MPELSANECWEYEAGADAPQYARMIPGVAAGPPPQSASKAGIAPKRAVVAIDEDCAKVAPRRTWAQLLMPHPIADPFSLYRQVVVDLINLAAIGSLQTLLVPEWGLPQVNLPLFVVLVTLFAFSEGIYGNSSDPFRPGILPGLARSILFATVLVYLAERDSMHLRAIPATFASSLCGLLLYRQWSHWTWVRHDRETGSRRALIVGAGPASRALARALRNDPLQRVRLQGFVDDDLPLSPTVLGRIEDLEWLARAEFIDEVILALPGEPELTRAVAEVAFRNHLDIRAIPEFPPGPWTDTDIGIECLGEVPVVTLHREHIPSAALSVKRGLDVTLAAFGLALAAPVMALVALMIRLDTPGPVIYAAKRVGIKGRPFLCYKFRSMVTNAEHLKDDLRAQNQRAGPIFKIVNDPRVTRVGRFIRRYSLDELPQLWNVLRGDMSLVGPRPHPVDEVNHYELHHYRRLDVKPGITGLWQISARHSPSFELNMHLDLTYIENWSLALDLRILLKTVRVLFAPEGD